MMPAARLALGHSDVLVLSHCYAMGPQTLKGDVGTLRGDVGRSCQNTLVGNACLDTVSCRRICWLNSKP